MPAAVGDKVPDVEVRTLGADGMPQPIRTGEALGTGKVVLFAVPGAFTPGCTKIHLPGFVKGADELRAKGVDTIACVAVNDAWVMDAWAKSQGADDKILMLADGNGEFTEAMGLVFDGGVVGLGSRSQRYAAIIEDGVITATRCRGEAGHRRQLLRERAHEALIAWDRVRVRRAKGTSGSANHAVSGKRLSTNAVASPRSNIVPSRSTT